MPLLLGEININDMRNTTVNQVGQTVVYDAAQAFLNRVNEDMAKALSVFVQETTEVITEAYALPGAGTLQIRGGRSRSGAVKSGGKWDVSYPIRDFGASVAGTDVDLAYMTAADFQTHVDTVVIQDRNTVRLEIMRRIFNNTVTTLDDEIAKITINVQPLANGDAVLYPPLEGVDDSATANHYYVTQYAASAISDTNNPVKYASDFLGARFGSNADEDNVMWINSAQEAKVRLLAGFLPVADRNVNYGVGISLPTNLPTIPGTIIGRVNGTWVSVWNVIPANYAFATRLGVPAPLKMRVDTVASGLPRGLALVSSDANYPMVVAEWRHRFGIGTANRLNGLVIFFDAGSTYTIPAIYA